jgi:UPF0176 protein
MSHIKNDHSFEVNAFYQFARLPSYQELQKPVQALCDANAIKGIILLADEGINGTIAGSPEAMELVREQLHRLTGLSNIEHKTSYCDEMPFLRMKVRLKAEIVTIGDKTVDPLSRVGTYVPAENWNELISDPDMIVIDTRNDFEVAIGSFKGAVDPRTTTFGEFPAFVRQHLDPKRHKKIAMFCTGGIRCEKASSFMLQEGFEEVYHLKGGVLKYLEVIPKEQSLWEGSCFVFDRRVAVEHGLEVSDLDVCYGCRHPLTPEDQSSALFEEGVCCPHCSDQLSEAQKTSARERQHQVRLGIKRGYSHIGPKTHPEVP